jgi:hypothetical protein
MQEVTCGNNDGVIVTAPLIKFGVTSLGDWDTGIRLRNSIRTVGKGLLGIEDHDGEKCVISLLDVPSARAVPDTSITSANGVVIGLVVVAAGSTAVDGQLRLPVGLSSSTNQPAVVGVIDSLPSSTEVHVHREGVREVAVVRGATTLDIRVGDSLTSAADGKAVLQVPAGVTTYRENQTRNYTLGRAMTAHSWGANDPATAEATINVLLA